MIEVVGDATKRRGEAAEILVELGIIGLSIFIAFLLQGAMAIRRLYATVRYDPVARGIVASVTAMAMFFLILSFKQGSLLTSQMLFTNIILLAQLDRIIQLSEPVIQKTLGQALPIASLP